MERTEVFAKMWCSLYSILKTELLFGFYSIVEF